jgi:hypothetical protein
VRGGSKSDLRDAFRLASCLWGGRFGLVADPAGDAETVDSAIERFRPDMFHALTETDASRAVVDRHGHLAWPLVGDGLVRGLEERVAVAPGEGFGAGGEGWARLSLAVADDQLELGLARLGRALRVS